MSNLTVEKSDKIITCHAGAAFVGQLLDLIPCLAPDGKFEGIDSPELRTAPQIRLQSILRTEVGLLTQSWSDFDDANRFLANSEFYQEALGIEDRIPAAPTLRQRLNTVAPEVADYLRKVNVDFLARAGVELGTVDGTHVPMDVDGSPFNNGKTHKEGVERCYNGVFGPCPVDVTAGTEGYMVGHFFRPGNWHAQRGALEILTECLAATRRLTDKPILVRMDSGNDAADNLALLSDMVNTDFIIKRNMRLKYSELVALAQDLASWCGDVRGVAEGLRVGKKVYLGSYDRTVYSKTFEKEVTVRTVYEITERTILANGQVLIQPEYEANFYWCSKSAAEWSDDKVIQLYHDHATMEQYHSMLKTDMDLERVPSGKFQTNTLFMQLATIAYNILRIIACTAQDVEEELNPAQPDEPAPRHRKRKYPWAQEVRETNRIPLHRPKTIIANLINMPGILISHARSKILKIANLPYWSEVFVRVFKRLSSMCGMPEGQVA